MPAFFVLLGSVRGQRVTPAAALGALWAQGRLPSVPPRCPGSPHKLTPQVQGPALAAQTWVGGAQASTGGWLATQNARAPGPHELFWMNSHHPTG